jgi:hypothetical protein
VPTFVPNPDHKTSTAAFPNPLDDRRLLRAAGFPDLLLVMIHPAVFFSWQLPDEIFPLCNTIRIMRSNMLEENDE